MTIFIAKAVLLALTTSTLVAAGLIHQEAPVGVHDSHQASPNSSAASHSLERRNGMLYCGNFASGRGTTANDLIDGIENDDQHSIAAQGCLRISCKDTTGLFVCNDRDDTLEVTGNEISKHAINIVEGCCTYSATGSKFWSYYMAGQQFTDALGGDWNVVIGYADCDQDVSQKPSDVGGWGVNESCKQFSTYIG